MRRTLPISLFVAAIAAGATGCSNGNAPAVRPRSYQLVSYGGAALPVTLRLIVESSTLPGGPTVTCDDKLTASSLELRKPAQFTQTDSHLLVCDDGRPNGVSQQLLRGTYDTGADTVVLSADVGSGTQYVSLARISTDGLTIYRREARSTVGATTIDPTQLVFRSVQN
ncbi:MAG TPA: hypothetical protein VG432_02165 [Gemmatimonadaceae bacterium]|nr:hypothetical protein [Gemmatimonadaceae bacterium]